MLFLIYLVNFFISFEFMTFTVYGIKIRYDDFQVHRIVPQKESELFNLRHLELNEKHVQFWKSPSTVGEPVDVMVAPTRLNYYNTFMNRFNLRSKIMISNVQKIIDNEDETNNNFFGNYHRLNEMHQWLHEIAEKHEEAKVINIGKTFEGRNILGINISYNSNNSRAIILEGNIHAREWISSASILYIINEILTNKEHKVRNTVEHFNWYIFPVINADGYEFTHDYDRLWRKTRVPYQHIKQICENNTLDNFGADPNRNFDFHWNESSTSNDPCSDIYCGPKPFSEPCVKALHEFTNKVASSLVGYIPIHSYSQKMLLPYGFKKRTYPPDHAKMLRITRKARKELYKYYRTRYTVGSSADILYEAGGASDDYTKANYNVPVVLTYELRDTGRYGFILPKNQIIPTAKETFYSLVELFKQFLAHEWSLK